MQGQVSIMRTLWRGLRKRCPRRGRGPLFRTWYTLHDRCGTCHLPLDAGEGDTWAFMYITTAGLTGAIIAVMLFVDPPATRRASLIVLPIALTIILGTLPRRKGMALACEYLLETREGEAARAKRKGYPPAEPEKPGNPRPSLGPK